MNTLGALSSQPIFHRLGVTLLDFLWQGALVALLWAAVRAMLGRARPSARYALGCAALAAMVVIPCWTLCARPAESPGSFPSGTERAGSALGQNHSSPAAVLDLSRGSLPRLEARDFARAIEPWPVVIWATGVFLLCLRFLLGWAAVARLRRGAKTDSPQVLREALIQIARRMRVSRPVRLLESAAIQVPTALGVLRPAILLPFSGLTGLSPTQIEALIAHELAHVRRHDYLVNLLQTAVETLLFYHPAVWWISRSVRLERESCCDDLAVEVTGDPRAYARALLRLEEQRVGTAQLALAATGENLFPRIARLFPRLGVESSYSFGRAGALLALAAIVTLGAAARGPSPIEASPDVLTGSALSGSPMLDAVPAPLYVEEDAAPRKATALARVSSPPARGSVAASDRDPRAKETQPRTLTAQELEDFRIHGVTADFIAEIEALGYSRASATTLLSLKIHGVSPDFLRRINEVFGERVSLVTAVDLRIHGVGPDFVAEMSRALGKISPDVAQSLRIHGVSPEYVARFREQGYGSLSADEAITIRNHGVDPGAAAEFVKMGFAKPTLDELLVARDHGVSVEYARGMRDTGLAIPNLDVMVALRNHGVTPDYLKSIREQGFSKLTADEAIVFRSHGVTSEYLRGFRARGYTNLSVDEAVALRDHGVTAEFAEKANASAGKRLSVDDLIDARIWRRRE